MQRSASNIQTPPVLFAHATSPRQVILPGRLGHLHFLFAVANLERCRVSCQYDNWNNHSTTSGSRFTVSSHKTCRVRTRLCHPGPDLADVISALNLRLCFLPTIRDAGFSTHKDAMPRTRNFPPTPLLLNPFALLSSLRVDHLGCGERFTLNIYPLAT